MSATRLLGIYIDCSEASSLGDVRICLVEQGSTGKAIMRVAGADDGGRVAAVFTAVTPESLLQMVEAIHGRSAEQRIA